MLLQNVLRMVLSVGLLVFSATGIHATEAVTLMHVHGLSYSSDGQKIFIPSHHGLAIYSAGQWSKAPGPEHDYMGFSVTRNAFYSSGHPAPNAGWVNPFGLIKSQDGGQTWQQLGLQGESDFHALATSYETNTVYVFSPGTNSRMSQPGLYHTQDDGVTWKLAQMQGAPHPFNLAVHPSQPNVVALGTEQGVFLSQDQGQTFQHLVRGLEIHATFFELDGEYLWFGSFDGQPSLTRVQWKTGKQEPLSLPVPAIVRDAVGYIAQNPAKRQEFAIATLARDVYVSLDQGKTWKQIAKKGITL